LLGGAGKKKFSSLLDCEDSAFALSDNLYLLLKKDKVTTRDSLQPPLRYHRRRKNAVSWLHGPRAKA
jgi:hypothetical protein